MMFWDELSPQACGNAGLKGLSPGHEWQRVHRPECMNVLALSGGSVFGCAFHCVCAHWQRPPIYIHVFWLFMLEHWR